MQCTRRVRFALVVTLELQLRNINMALFAACRSLSQISVGMRKCSRSLLSSFKDTPVTSCMCSRNATRTVKHSVKSNQEVEMDTGPFENKESKDIISLVNEKITTAKYGRLFAVVHLCGKQFKVTEGDIILVEGYWPPEVGDKIRLEKVMLMGGADFTLIGRPLLSDDLVNVRATVIEKTLSHTKTHFRKRRRKQYMRINFYRCPFTMLRINCIEFQGKLGP